MGQIVSYLAVLLAGVFIGAVGLVLYTAALTANRWVK